MPDEPLVSRTAAAWDTKSVPRGAGGWVWAGYLCSWLSLAACGCAQPSMLKPFENGVLGEGSIFFPHPTLI